jgi:hypothetical protein
MSDTQTDPLEPVAADPPEGQGGNTEAGLNLDPTSVNPEADPPEGQTGGGGG